MTYVPPPPSSVPKALQYLKKQFEQYLTIVEDPNASDIGVFIGDEGKNRPKDIVLIDHEVRRKLVPRALVGGGGAGYMIELYEIDTVISCWRGSPEPIAIQDRAYQLLAYLENVVRQDMTLGGTVNIQGKPTGTTGGTPEWTDDPAGRICEITLTIECQNSL